MSQEQKINAYLSLDTKEFNKKMGKVQRDLKSFSREASKLGRGLLTNVGLPAAFAAGKAFEVARGFDLTQRKIAALSGSKKIIADLASEARRLGAETIFSAEEVSELQLSLTRMGRSKEEIKAVTPTILRLAQALDTDLAGAGELIFRTLNQFPELVDEMGGSMQAATRVADILAKGAASGAATFEELGDAMKYAGTLSGQTGIDLETATAAIVALVNSGLDAPKAGVYLRALYSEMAKGGDIGAKAFQDVLDGTLSAEEALSKYNIRGGQAALVLQSMNGEFRDLVGKLRDSNGFLSSMDEIMGGSLDAHVKELTSAISEMALALFDAFGEKIIGKITEFTKAIRSLTEQKLDDVVTGVKTLAYTLGGAAVLAGIGAFSSGLSTVVSLLSKAANLAAGNPIAAAVIYSAGAFVKGKITADNYTEAVDDYLRRQEDFDKRAKKLGAEYSAGNFKGAEQQFKTLVDNLVAEGKSLGAEFWTLFGKAGEIDPSLVAFMETGNFESAGGEIAEAAQKLYGALNDVEGGTTSLFLKNLETFAKRDLRLAEERRNENKKINNELDKSVDLIEQFEAANGRIEGSTVDEKFRSSKELLEKAQAAAAEIAKQVAEVSARGGEVSEDLKGQADDMSLLVDYYKAVNREYADILKNEQDWADAMSKRIGLEALAYNWAERQRQKAQENKAAIESLSGTQREMFEKLRAEGLSFGEAMTAVTEVLGPQIQGMIEQFGAAFEQLGRGLTEAMIDPAKKGIDVLKDWLKQVAVSVAGAIAKYMGMALGLKIANRLSGGMLKNVLKIMAAGVDVASFTANSVNPAQIIDQLAGGTNGRSAFDVNVHGHISGYDLVLAARRGAHAADRIYG